MVSGEVTGQWCLRHSWSLAPTVVIRVDLLGGRGQCCGAGDGGIPGHAAGDDDV
jgi:hypothetical protein